MYNDKKYIFLNSYNKNFEDLLIDAILFPKTFLKIVKNRNYIELLKNNYNIKNDFLIDILYSFICTYKRNIFNYLYHLDYFNDENEHIEIADDFIELFFEVLKYKIKDEELDVKDVVKNLKIAYNNETILHFFESEIKKLLKFIIDYVIEYEYNDKKLIDTLLSFIEKYKKDKFYKILYFKLKRIHP